MQEKDKKITVLQKTIGIIGGIIAIIGGLIAIHQFISPPPMPGIRLVKDAKKGDKIHANMIVVGPDDGGLFKVKDDVVGSCLSVNLPKGSPLTIDNTGECN